MANDITVKRAEPMLPAHYSFGELERMAKAVSASKLFGVKTDAEALSLLLLAQAEGRHPMIAARDYHVIEGKPSLKADAMLARFHEAGGRVEWHQVDDSACIATFSHPQGGSYKVNWTIDDARDAGLADKQNWKRYTRAMLRSRAVSEGVRTVWPAVIVGTYTPEELRDGDAELTEVIPRGDAAREPVTIDAEPQFKPATVVDAATGEVLTLTPDEPDQAQASPQPSGALTEHEIAAWEGKLRAAANPEDLKRTYADAYRVAHKAKDTAALGRFDKVKDARKRGLGGAE